MLVLTGQKSHDAAKIRKMLDCGWPVDARDDGAAAQYWAVFHANAGLVSLVSGCDAPIDVIDSNHGSITSWLAQTGDYPVVIDLLRA